MKTTIRILHLLLIPLLGIITVQANASGYQPTCSQAGVAGRWAFATDVGQQAILPGGDITALGIFTVDKEGLISGKFDATLYEYAALEEIAFTGVMTVNEDCTGTLTFETSAGTSRTDSIVILNRSEFWGMSKDIHNLWNYKARRLPRM